MRFVSLVVSEPELMESDEGWNRTRRGADEVTQEVTPAVTVLSGEDLLLGL